MTTTPDNFAAFNEQLAQLASAHLPIEQGLRLIADDLRRGRLAGQIRAVADELERGVPLAEAFERHGGDFPPLYARLIDAGMRSGNLGGMLMNLGRHLELMQRLRAAMWRTCAYPIAVLIFLAVILTFIRYFLLPQFAVIYVEFAKVDHGWGWWYFLHHGNLSPPTFPVITEVLFAASKAAPVILLLSLIAIIAGPLIMRRSSRSNLRAERFVIRFPLIGPIIQRSLIARWCDVTAMGVSAGMDLPGAMRLASEAIHSPALSADGTTLAQRAERGQPLNESGLAFLPAVVPAAMQQASAAGDLPATLASLTDLYERQAKLRLENLPAILSPILLALIATLIGFTVIALLLPLVQFVDYYMQVFT